LLDQSDVVLLLEVDQVEQTLRVSTRYPRGTGTSRVAAATKLISVGVGDMQISSTTNESGRLYPLDLAIGGDPVLVAVQLKAELERALAENPSSRDRFEARDRRIEEARSSTRARWRQTADREADSTPIALSRLAQEMWDLVREEPFVVSGNAGGWTRRLWQLERPSEIAGFGGAAALGSALPKAIGAALAARDQGRFVVHFNGDGDFLYGPSALWTAVHHHIPMLIVVLNNGGYMGEGGHVVWAAEQRERSTERKHIAVDIQNPGVDFAGMARAQGAYAEGPIENHNDLGPALQRALRIMKEQSTVALLDVRTAAQEGGRDPLEAPSRQMQAGRV
jgi:thiamine pyrophosphate-dependent acetolactate synthase large subunit-like protein